MIHRILVLDGGGARGVFTYRFLHHFKERTSQFDLIVSVSVGALIGAMIACGKIQMDDSLQVVEKYMSKIFSGTQKYGAFLNPKYDGVGKTAILKEVFKNMKLKDCTIKFAVLLCTMTGEPKMVRSWDEKDGELSMVEVLDATTAAPTYFPPIRIEDTWFIDGGVLENTPIINCLLEILELFELKYVRILSIGTYQQPTPKKTTVVPDTMGIFAWIGSGLFDIMMRTNDTTSIKLIERLVENFIRIGPNAVYTALDNIDQKTIDIHCANADKAWTEHMDTIRIFFE